MEKIFLQAEWRKLAMANYEVSPDLLKPYLPPHTELDLWNGRCYASLVGFMFVNTKVLGIKIPFHVNFEEINLRFYVKHKGDDGVWKRGVVFIKEIVPKPAITLVANTLYRENYVTMPTRHIWDKSNEHLHVEYTWKHKRKHHFSVLAECEPLEMEANSEEEFITEHYWGYTKWSESATSEYQVEHPQWQVYKVHDYTVDVDFGLLYGTDFGLLNKKTPDSVLLAEGSEVVVRKGKTLR